MVTSITPLGDKTGCQVTSGGTGRVAGLIIESRKKKQDKPAVMTVIWQAGAENEAMCQRVQCSKCGKPTWRGCGRHIEEALRGVPPAERCQCPRPKSLLARLLGR